MSRGNDGIPIFHDEKDRMMFLELLGEEAVRCGWLVHDYVLMGNHYHLVIETPECTLSIGMHHLLTTYVRRFNRRHCRRGHLFGDRFKNVLVQQEEYGLTLSRYIALNPVRAGLVKRPENWPWSSYAVRAGLVEAPEWLTIAPLASLFGDDAATQQRAYREFVLSAIGAEDDLLASAVAGMYLGTKSWIDRVQKIIDGEERSEEHPRPQVHPGRPTLDDVIEAVASTFDTTPETIRSEHGTLARRMVAWFAFDEAMVPLRRIAKELGVKSAGGMSSLISRFRAQLAKDAEVRELAMACRTRMRRRPPPSFVFPSDLPPPTMRGYHRKPSVSRR
ncbi:MAG TPA: transposase [Thermoanaerobaculia bacterium]|nr:transposase [Thermoanaerobaculia bacterium]